jgi:hypothetical protein
MERTPAQQMKERVDKFIQIGGAQIAEEGRYISMLDDFAYFNWMEDRGEHVSRIIVNEDGSRRFVTEE